jgi:hypothetical protein
MARESIQVVEVIVSLKRIHATVIVGWLAAVAGLLGARIAFGSAPVSATEAIVWLLVGSVPATIFLFTFRGAPPPTIAQVLYDAEQRPDATAQVPPAGGSRAVRR